MRCLLWGTAIIRRFLLSYVCLSISRPHQSAQLDLTFPGPISLVYAITYLRLIGLMCSLVALLSSSIGIGFYILSVLGLMALSLVLLSLNIHLGSSFIHDIYANYSKNESLLEALQTVQNQ